MKASLALQTEVCRFVGHRFRGDDDPVLDQAATVSREVLQAMCHRFTVGRLSGLITLDSRSGEAKGPRGG